MSREEVAVISAVRSPFGKFGGTLKDFTLPKLGGVVAGEAIRRAGITSEDVEEVAIGVNLPGGDRSIARQLLIEAGIPTERVAYTVDRACCSSMAAVNMASRSIRLGEVAVALAGGAENMSRVPYFLTDFRWGHRLGDVHLKDQLVIADPMTRKPRAVQAGEEGVEFGITREDQDRWAVRIRGGVERLDSPQDRRERVQRHADDVHQGLLRGQVGTGREREDPQRPAVGVLSVEAAAHDAVPNPARRAVFRHLFEELHVGGQECEERGREIVHFEPALDGGLAVGDAVGKCECQLLDSAGAGLANVVAAHGERCPAREMPRAVLDDVCGDAQASPRGRFRG